MLQFIKPEMLCPMLKQEHPEWNDAVLSRQAAEYIGDIHQILEPVLYNYLTTGVKSDFTFGKFSIFQIQIMQPGKSYFAALLLLNEYIKDRQLGEALILRHW